MKRVAETLKHSLIEDWLKLTPLQSGKTYDIIPLVKQDTAQLVATLKRLTTPKEKK